MLSEITVGVLLLNKNVPLDNPTREDVPVAPVAPVGPVAPFAPVAPVGPVMHLGTHAMPPAIGQQPF